MGEGRWEGSGKDRERSEGGKTGLAFRKVMMAMMTKGGGKGRGEVKGAEEKGKGQRSRAWIID